MVVGKTEQGTIQKFARQYGQQSGRNYAYPAVEQLFADEIYRDERQSAQNSRHPGAHRLDGMQSWWSYADKPANASDKEGEERSTKANTPTGVQHIGVKGIEVGEVVNHVLYLTDVKIGVGLAEPDPTVEESLVIRQVCAYVERDTTENSQDYTHYGCRGET